MNKQSILFSNFLHTPATAHLASFEVAYRITKFKKHILLRKNSCFLLLFDLVSTRLKNQLLKN